MWSDHRDAAPFLPQAPSLPEKELVLQVRDRISDLFLSNEYLEDKNLVRFIRARSGSINQAEQMIRKNVEWMAQEKIDELLRWKYPPNLEDYFPWWVCGFDEFGGPIVVIQTGLWEPAHVSGMKTDLVRYLLLIIEKCRRVLYARSTNRDYIPQFSVIIDCLGLGWKHYLSYDGIQAAILALRYFEANYPDSLRLGAAVNCPSVLNMMWKMVKPFVSPATRSKLRFLYEDDRLVWRETLTRYFPEDRFPAKYGGTLPDSYKVRMEFKGHNAGDENGN
ncbi:SEC14-like protein 2 [Folsomia candida]|uniref:SEC14-like protein 2 n=1 Tax=Folsomia candida TaxID=158441 RepID=UPI0016054442|nr:SEC14-like protein 2 [Folsomia candida]